MPGRILRVRSVTREDNYESLIVQSRPGNVSLRLYKAEGSSSAVIFVGGVGGGFDTPAQDLYPRLAAELVADRITSLRVQFRDPVDLEECVEDVLTGVEYLATIDKHRLALVGHSFGGAVVINAAVAAPDVVTVVTLSTQSYGADVAADLTGKPLLLIHGEEDEVLPAYCSTFVYNIAPEPKTLRVVPGARHVLDEAADEVHALVKDWLLRYLGPATR